MIADKEMVCLVLDPNYGERIALLAKRFNVWVVDTPTNRNVVERLWQQARRDGATSDVTTFKVSAGENPVDTCLGTLRAIENHHNEYAQPPPYRMVEVFGLVLSDPLQEALEKQDFTKFEKTDEGFKAIKGLGSEDT